MSECRNNQTKSKETCKGKINTPIQYTMNIQQLDIPNNITKTAINYIQYLYSYNNLLCIRTAVNTSKREINTQFTHYLLHYYLYIYGYFCVFIVQRINGSQCVHYNVWILVYEWFYMLHFYIQFSHLNSFTNGLINSTFKLLTYNTSIH